MARSTLKLAFIDRDGVINVRRKDPDDPMKHYVLTWDAFEWMPGAIEAIAKLLDNDYAVIVVSNQSGIGQGVADYFEVDHIFQKMVKTIRGVTRRPHSRLWYSFCPHTTEDDCVCRKPQPGLIISHLVELNARTANAWMIGDADTDMEAGWNAGIDKLIKLPSYEEPEIPEYKYVDIAADVPVEENAAPVVANLTVAVDFLLRWDREDAHKANQAAGLCI